jgi:hypothetical protein
MKFDSAAVMLISQANPADAAFRGPSDDARRRSVNRPFMRSARVLICATPMMLTGAQGASAQAVFINEVHYENIGTDAGEAIPERWSISSSLASMCRSRAIVPPAG